MSKLAHSSDEHMAIIEERSRDAETEPRSPATHTPTPWRVDEKEPGELWISNSERTWPVCMVTGSGFVSQRDRADAELICKAVNSHAALLALLEDCREELESGLETEGELEAEHSVHARKLVARISSLLKEARS